MLSDYKNLTSDMTKCSGGFYNCMRIISFMRPWNFVAGSRSVGKSTNIACFFILDFLHNGHKFIYTRRRKDETLLTCRTFFGNAVSIINRNTSFEIKDLIYERGKYKIKYKRDDEEVTEECGMIIPLSEEQKYKSSNLSEYFNLVFDEFIPKERTQYLGSLATPDVEYNAMLSLYQTIDRGIDRPFRNELRVFFLGNKATVYNPIFLKLNIIEFYDDEARFVRPKNKLWIVENVDTVAALDQIQESFGYQLATEDERDYAYRNRGREKADWIARPTGSRTYICTLALKGKNYGVIKTRDGKIFIDNFQDIGRPIFSLDIASHNGNDLRLISNMMQEPIIDIVISAFRQGRLYFKDVGTRIAISRVIRFTTLSSEVV